MVKGGFVYYKRLEIKFLIYFCLYLKKCKMRFFSTFHFHRFDEFKYFQNCFKGSKGEKGSSAHFPGFSRNIVHSSEVAGFPVNFIEGPPGPPGLPGKKVENITLHITFYLLLLSYYYYIFNLIYFYKFNFIDCYFLIN